MLTRLRELTTGMRAVFRSAGLQQEDFVRRLLARDEKYQDPRNLNRFEYRMLSQGGEDGIIAEVFRRIGQTNRTLIDVGSGDGLENNTASLLVQGWSGYWLESSRRCLARARSRYRQLLRGGSLVVKRQRVTAENIEAILSSLGVPDAPDLLSIDIDGNDYWVWKAISAVTPRVVVIEYNPVFHTDVRWVMAYAPRHRWDGSTYYGASLASLVELGNRKGYRLVACSLSGVNAFFVREDQVAERFQEPYTADRHWEPARLALTLPTSHPPGFGDFAGE